MDFLSAPVRQLIAIERDRLLMQDPLLGEEFCSDGTLPSEPRRKPSLLFPRAHFKAVLFRRWVLIKRSLRMIIITLLMTLFFTALAIFAHWLMTTLIHKFTFRIDFKFLTEHPDSEVLIAADSDSQEHLPFVEMLGQIYRSDMNKTARFHNFSSRDALNAYMFAQFSANPRDPPPVCLGVAFNSYYPWFNFTAIHNTSAMFECSCGG
jgi:hypothetical protein